MQTCTITPPNHNNRIHTPTSPNNPKLNLSQGPFCNSPHPPNSLSFFHTNFHPPKKQMATPSLLSPHSRPLTLSLSPSPFSRRTLPTKLLSHPLHFSSSPVSSKPTILVAEKLGEAGLLLLREFANVDCSYDLSAEELCAKISLCDALIVRDSTKVTRDVFEAAKGRLKVVGRAGAGTDNVDLQSATESGCLIVTAPTSHTVAAAEHGVALLLAMARNIPSSNSSLKSGKWERSRFLGVSLTGKTLAVLGFGKVGAEVARRAKGLGMSVVAHDPYASAERARAAGVRTASFEEAVGAADFVSLHLPLTPGTKGMFGDGVFARMKRGVRIVNVARGGVVDELALVRALDDGIVAQAALDVFEEEPPPIDNKLVHHQNVIVTPHLGASTEETQEEEAVEIAEVVIGALNGDFATTAVNAPTVSPKALAELSPYMKLCEKLGRLAIQLVSPAVTGIKQVKIIYTSSRDPDDLDPRILRSTVIKGLLEPLTNTSVNLVNSDYMATQRGLQVTEERIFLDGSQEIPLDSVEVRLSNVESRFASALSEAGEIRVLGRVSKEGREVLGLVGESFVDVSLEGSLMLCRQVDRPGVIARVGNILGDADVNVSFMSVARVSRRGTAVMAVGVDEVPAEETLRAIGAVEFIEEFVFVQL